MKDITGTMGPRVAANKIPAVVQRRDKSEPESGQPAPPEAHSANSVVHQKPDILHQITPDTRYIAAAHVNGSP